MERRDFLSKVMVGGSILFAAPVYLSSCSKSSDSGLTTTPGTGSSGAVTIDLSQSKYSNLGTVGGYVYYQNLIIIRTGDSQYVALSKICTHQGCTVGYSSSIKEIACPCHGARYSLDGTVLRGPAQRPLTKYDVTVNNNTLSIS
ncbi:MAG TPA: Rieske (2Fe-2S) protein [Sunxiuqinia sp.]|nr:Rieske (2Fe-2S) protein [Sunxiuqinia sp.]